MKPIVLVLGAAAVGTGWALLSSGKKKGPTVVVGTSQRLPTQEDAPPGTDYYAIQAAKDVGPNAQTVIIPLRTLGKGSSITDARFDVAITTTLKSTNAYYGTAGEQFCRGIRMLATLTRGGTGVLVDNTSIEDSAAACTAQVTPGQESHVHPWPIWNTLDLTPAAKLRMQGDSLQLVVDAPALKFGDVVVWGSGEGHTNAWYKQHTGPLRYTLRVTGTLRLAPR